MIASGQQAGVVVESGAADFVEGVASEKGGDESAGGFPVASENVSAGDGDPFAGAPLFEPGDRDGVARFGFVPGKRIHIVADTVAGSEVLEPISPKTVIDEADGHKFTDPESGIKGFPREGEHLEGARNDDNIETGGSKITEGTVNVGLVAVDSPFEATGDLVAFNIDPEAVNVPRLTEVFEKDAPPAAKVEDPAVWFNPPADDLEIDLPFATGSLEGWAGLFWGDLFHSGAFRNASMRLNSSGERTRKESWPRTESISA